MTTSQAHQNKIGIACPHCGSGARTRSSRPISVTCRQANCACLNVECGFTFGVTIEITHFISPSATPNPAVILRQSPPRTRLPANDTHPIAANDGEHRGPEVPPFAANDDEAPSAEAAGS